ncbi:hypothetical protein SCWH03_46250 [Streptomyces pacificus]|uniref:Uncharacterized protein n=1 Tax=Streptomyces pacificus TaxID=2705029 RepID=A0A6A0B0Z7_9ACTN|nr:hypothetical protein SCWH03_46250 [Streptomyces pacificus]
MPAITEAATAVAAALTTGRRLVVVRTPPVADCPFSRSAESAWSAYGRERRRASPLRRACPEALGATARGGARRSGQAARAACHPVRGGRHAGGTDRHPAPMTAGKNTPAMSHGRQLADGREQTGQVILEGPTRNQGP